MQDEMPLSTPRGIFEAVMAGSDAVELLPHLKRLPEDERELVLLTLYAMRNEIAANCQARADEIDHLLSLVVPPNLHPA